VTGIDDPGVARLLEQRNHAVASTLNEDGSIHSTVVWVNVVDGKPAVNSALGRKWPTNLERNPTITLVVYDESNPYEYVEIRGTAAAMLEGADEHIDLLAKKYMDKDRYPFRQPGEQRVTFRIEPTLVRHQTPP
jgi:PPOX class probable F420-dependent enzyme